MIRFVYSHQSSRGLLTVSTSLPPHNRGGFVLFAYSGPLLRHSAGDTGEGFASRFAGMLCKSIFAAPAAWHKTPFRRDNIRCQQWRQSSQPQPCFFGKWMPEHIRLDFLRARRRVVYPCVYGVLHRNARTICLQKPHEKRFCGQPLLITRIIKFPSLPKPPISRTSGSKWSSAARRSAYHLLRL